MLVTKDTKIKEVLAGKAGAAEVLLRYGTHCLTCANTGVNSVADMARKHRVDLRKLLAELNSLADQQ